MSGKYQVIDGFVFWHW